MNKHLTCFSNSFDCFAERVPALTFIVVLLVVGLASNFVFCFDMPPDTSYLAEIFFKTIMGIIAIFSIAVVYDDRKSIMSYMIGGGFLHNSIKHLGGFFRWVYGGGKSLLGGVFVKFPVVIYKELCDLLVTIKNCTKCREDKKK